MGTGSRLMAQGSWLMSQPANRFVSIRSCVLACARSGCPVEFKRSTCDQPFPFSLLPHRAFPFPSLPTPTLVSYFSWPCRYIACQLSGTFNYVNSKYDIPQIHEIINLGFSMTIPEQVLKADGFCVFSDITNVR